MSFSWSISYVHRPPLAKVDYEKEIKRVATFGSVCFARKGLELVLMID